MKDITDLVKKYQSSLSSANPDIDYFSIKRMAEVRSFWDVVLPEGYCHYNIGDFDGILDSGKKEIDDDVALNAKKKIIEYCWDLTIEKISEIKLNRNELSKYSLIPTRRDNGHNVFIYGGDDKKKVGRTMVASLIMKEAILQRTNRDGQLDSYDWVNFSVLKEEIAKEREAKELPDLNSYKNSTWLVIDNIRIKGSESISQQMFLSSLLEPFFFFRVKNKLPTIFVFRENISQDIYVKNITNFFGDTVYSIFINKNTTHICLS